MLTNAKKTKFQPALRSHSLRVALGAALTLGCAATAASINGVSLALVVPPVLIAWGVSIWVTDKYRHKYPQRYYPYLVASHGKAAVVFAVVLAAFGFSTLFLTVATAIVEAAVWVVIADFVLSLPRRRFEDAAAPPAASTPQTQTPVSAVDSPRAEINTREILQGLARDDSARVPAEIPHWITRTISASDSGVATWRVTDGDSAHRADTPFPVALAVHLRSLNAVRRLNLFLQGLSQHVIMGGYAVIRYRPMDEYLKALREEKRGVRLWWSYGWHFMRYRALPKIPILETVYFSRWIAGLDEWVSRRTGDNRRVISRAEMWGRIYYWGFEVLDEHQHGDDYWVLCRRVRPYHADRTPSFYMVARLTKVGLAGKPIYLHKLRSMYPFSEFVQEKIYKDHGLSETGKFRNDFRLTDYGRLLRRYWLDEIPQIFDWLRGEIKLVGMRATSPHFLSLYPRELYDLYVETKPGLIPPIFDSSTAGFEDIVRIEFDYLSAYQRRPVATDVRYLFKTLHDIVIRGIRSK